MDSSIVTTLFGLGLLGLAFVGLAAPTAARVVLRLEKRPERDSVLK